MASGMFTIDDLGQSSTFRELRAIYYVLLSFVEHLKHKRVKIFTDNQSAARIVSVGSSKVHLQSVALKHFSFLFFTRYCFGSSVDSKVTQREG